MAQWARVVIFGSVMGLVRGRFSTIMTCAMSRKKAFELESVLRAAIVLLKEILFLLSSVTFFLKQLSSVTNGGNEIR